MGRRGRALGVGSGGGSGIMVIRTRKQDCHKELEAGKRLASVWIFICLSLPTSTTSLSHNSPRKPEEMQPLQLSDIELNLQWGVGVRGEEAEDGWGKEGGGEEQERASGVSEGRGRVEGGGLEWEC